MPQPTVIGMIVTLLKPMVMGMAVTILKPPLGMMERLKPMLTLTWLTETRLMVMSGLGSTIVLAASESAALISGNVLNLCSCKSTDHLARECPDKPPGSDNCFNCGQPG